MTLYIAPIVEGQTEAECVERLLQRVWAELLAAPIRLQVLAPSRGQRDALINTSQSELANKLGEATAKLAQCLRRDTQGRGLLLLLLDAERDCPAELAPILLRAAQTARNDIETACVLAKTMLENWIVAGASTLAGVNGLPETLPTRSDHETGSGAKWLEKQLRSRNKSRKYKKTVDAEVFIRAMNLQECRANAPSFDKLCRDLEARLPPPEPPAQPDPPTE